MFRLIAAVDRKRGLAKQGFQPWNIPQARRQFIAQTKQYGGNILAGRTTFDLFYKGQPLADRQNYVLTRDKTPIEGVELVHDLEKFLREWQDKDVWIIGGANLFAQVMELDRADELFLTQIQNNFGCNQFLPPYEDKFVLAEESQLHEENGFIFTFAKYVAKH